MWFYEPKSGLRCEGRTVLDKEDWGKSIGVLAGRGLNFVVYIDFKTVLYPPGGAVARNVG